MDISRRTLIGALGAGLGSVGLAAATGSNSTTTTSSEAQHESEKDSGNDTGNNDNETGQHGAQHGDQNAPDNQSDGENNDGESDSKSETGEKSFTQADVKLAPADAKQAATSTVSGNVSSVSLENHDGSPVYQVIVTPASGTAKQVTVNANTGTVVKTESASED
ncbi:PepSY domain-containing protein [Halocalculus aciditolerans]|uniref:PepSY domain-containing protein n=1 Tax=Halocalculus aciditolerans TaxID=1383812 RepID=A0A830FNV4_9EURY|nr:PepSY domain-containing protein [Halocalculus aciditolerans]GGL71728.1 hypothetical protein GCM10009039_32260 [Halocalculus aciditolerans]